ncbi:hypothetical protein SUDANB21_06862 (plasmid) [Streptomyces sp. enrichment culture]
MTQSIHGIEPPPDPGRFTVFQLPSYSPDLNPQEGIWSLVKRDIGNLAAADLGQITRAVKRRLRQIQYRTWSTAAWPAPA